MYFYSAFAFGGGPLSICFLFSPVASRQPQRCWPKIRSRPHLFLGLATTGAPTQNTLGDNTTCRIEEGMEASEIMSM